MATGPQTDPAALSADARLPARREASVVSLVLGNRGVLWGGMLLLVMVAIALLGPSFTSDPMALNPIKRLKPPSEEFLFGTDFLGRDIFARVVYGSRISLAVGLAVALIA
ncbi:MAG TPA: ABC transporter permease, partial [Rhodospirillales bacterium]|nr:ABC transporter permease [Rhodospirillales bacterium]